MLDLWPQLETCLRGRVCFVGLGNPARGDDGLGLRLAEAIANLRGSEAATRQPRGDVRVLLVGTDVERWGSALARLECDQVVFLDAVDFGGRPGSVVWLEADQIRARFPQVSTHRLSLGVWAQWFESGGTRRVALLGVQPGSLRRGSELSGPVAGTVTLLAQWIAEAREGPMAEAPGLRTWTQPPGSVRPQARSSHPVLTSAAEVLPTRI